jgi:hypothetical protein
MTTTELSAHPERATHRATHTVNQVATGRVRALLAEHCYQATSVLVERLLGPPQRTPQQNDNPAGAPACVAVRK